LPQRENIGPLESGFLDWRAAMMVVSHMRFAAGVCVLATGLLLSGAGSAIAAAAPDTHGFGTHGHNGADGSSQGRSPTNPTANSPTGGVTNTVRLAFSGVTSELGSSQKLGLPGFTGATSPKVLPGGTVITDAKKGTGPVAAVPSSVAPVPTAAAPVTSLVARVGNAVEPVTNPVTNMAAQVPDAVAPVINAAAQAPGAVAPLTNMLALVPNLVAPVTNVVASAPSLFAPGLDVIAAVQDMLASAVGTVVLLAELPFDLVASLLGVSATAGPAMNAPPGIGGVRQTAAANPSRPAAPMAASQLLLPLPVAGVPDGPRADNTAALGMPGDSATLVSLDSPLPAPSAQAPDATSPWHARFHYGQAVAAFLVTASVAALAAAAWPGIAALGIFTAVGVRIGQRQAKTGFALQASGIARFARQGPLGVVRSNGLVAIHRRTAGAEHRFDNVA
jgi:hypothetical protein